MLNTSNDLDFVYGTPSPWMRKGMACSSQPATSQRLLPRSRGSSAATAPLQKSDMSPSSPEMRSLKSFGNLSVFNCAKHMTKTKNKQFANVNVVCCVWVPPLIVYCGCEFQCFAFGLDVVFLCCVRCRFHFTRWLCVWFRFDVFDSFSIPCEFVFVVWFWFRCLCFEFVFDRVARFCLSSCSISFFDSNFRVWCRFRFCLWMIFSILGLISFSIFLMPTDPSARVL